MARGFAAETFMHEGHTDIGVKVGRINKKQIISHHILPRKATGGTHSIRHRSTVEILNVTNRAKTDGQV